MDGLPVSVTPPTVLPTVSVKPPTRPGLARS